MRKWIPELLSVVFMALAVSAAYQVIVADGCIAARGSAACPPIPRVHQVLWLVAMVGLVVLIFAGAGVVAFMAVFAAVGLPLMLAGINDVEATDPSWIWLGASFALFPPLLVAGLIAFGVRSALAKQRLFENGREGIGTVLTVADTNVTINKNPRLRMRMRVEPLDTSIAPYEVEKAATVPRIAIPRPGDRFPVWIDPDDPTKFVFAATPPEPQAPARLHALWQRAKGGLQPTVPPAAQTPADVVAEMKALNDRRRRGEVDEAEFAARAAALLDVQPPG